MELPDCRVGFLDISALNPCEQYAKAGSSLPNHVMKKTLDNCPLRAADCLLSAPSLSPVCVSAVFSYLGIFSSYPKVETIPNKSPWSPCQTSGGYNIGHKSKCKNSNTKVHETLLNIL